MKNFWKNGFFSRVFDTKFFTVSTHPVNLAVFRIVFALVSLFQIPWEKTLALAAWPASLRFPPAGLGWFVNNVPINPQLVTIAAYAYWFFCFCLLFGLFARTAAFGVAVSAFYVLGIKTFFGSVSHAQHHVVLFSMVLALSPCGDALSIDAILRAVRSGGGGNFPHPGRAYTLPIRIIWILIGIIYFFPGFWKLRYSGLDWALGENMKYQLYHKWFWYNWTPFFRIDSYPLLYRLGGLWTLFFETSFLFLLFVPKLRFVPIVMGFLFHIFTAVFMRIQFWGLAFCYVVFSDWHRIFKKLGERFYKQSLHLMFRKKCKACTYFVETARTLDIFERVNYLSLADEEEFHAQGPHIFGMLGTEKLENKKLLLHLIKRVPFLLFLLPLLLLPESCFLRWNLSHHTLLQSGQRAAAGGEKRRMAPLALLGSLLISAQLLFGFTQTMDGWPFACYPTFRKAQGPIDKVADLKFYDKTNKPIDEKRIGKGGKRIRQLLKKILALKDPEERKEKLTSFFSVFETTHPKLRKVETIEVYKSQYLVFPENFKSGPVKTKRIGVYKIERT